MPKKKKEEGCTCFRCNKPKLSRPLHSIVEELAGWVATLASHADFDNADEMEMEIRALAEEARNAYTV
jgi:hypothetical protein